MGRGSAWPIHVDGGSAFLFNSLNNDEHGMDQSRRQVTEGERGCIDLHAGWMGPLNRVDGKHGRMVG